jgi:excisionase family DNA binding protein
VAPHQHAGLTHPILQDDAGDPCNPHELGQEEVARILGRTPREVNGLARRGELRAKRMGTRWRFRREDVMAYLEKSFSD